MHSFNEEGGYIKLKISTSFSIITLISVTNPIRSEILPMAGPPRIPKKASAGPEATSEIPSDLPFPSEFSDHTESLKEQSSSSTFFNKIASISLTPVPKILPDQKALTCEDRLKQASTSIPGEIQKPLHQDSHRYGNHLSSRMDRSFPHICDIGAPNQISCDDKSAWYRGENN